MYFIFQTISKVGKKFPIKILLYCIHLSTQYNLPGKIRMIQFEKRMIRWEWKLTW